MLRGRTSLFGAALTVLKLDRPTWGGRLQRSLELLGKARADISEEEDNPSSKVHGLRVEDRKR